VPDIIRASGRTPDVSTLPTDAFQIALRDKLREEVAELLAAQRADDVVVEAADVLEVLAAMAAQHCGFDRIIEIARRKRQDRGGFDKRLWLEGVDTAEGRSDVGGPPAQHRRNRSQPPRLSAQTVVDEGKRIHGARQAGADKLGQALTSWLTR
jgi:predicted house-cleaning noncanonical NTP pyrophosphatase (MazG superfamily)